MVMNRSEERALALRADFPAVEIVEEGEALSMDPDVIINCTPLGMRGFPDRLPIDPEVFREGQFVMDTIYNPTVTRMMVEAQGRGATVRSGIEMLIYQAIAAFQIWTGVSPPFEVMAQAFKERLS
jgi:shikimate 5-dehydrogenase